MSLLSDFEAKLSADAKAVYAELSSFEKAVAAKLFSGLTAAEQTVVDMLPDAATALKAYTLQLVQLAEKNFVGAALGDVKYSVVFYQLFQAVKLGFIPGIKTIAVPVIKASIEAAVLAMGIAA